MRALRHAVSSRMTSAFALLAVVALAGALMAADSPSPWVLELAYADEPATGSASDSATVGAEGEATSSSEDQAANDDGVEAAQTRSGATSVDDAEGNYVDPAQAADNSFIYDTSIASLAQEASFHDGQVVQIIGEVVGDRIAASEQGHYWITIEAEEANDSSSISAYVTESQTEKIDRYGRYGVVGTRVQVRGVYHQACIDHDGLADIHVSTLEVVSPGSETPDTLVMREFLPGIILIAVGLALVALFRIVRERMR